MCGRFAIDMSAEAIAWAFNVSLPGPFGPRYNIAPTQNVPIIRNAPENNERQASFMRWGLIPHWAKDEKIGYRLINARGESVDDRPSFRAAFKHRRCLIPTTGFYEWDKTQKVRQPYYIGMKNGDAFAFAGLWEVWEDAGRNTVESFTIITTNTNELIKPLHDRMPVILAQEIWDTWLDTANENQEFLKSLLVPYPSQMMQMYAVSTDVNNTHNEGARLIEKVLNA